MENTGTPQNEIVNTPKRQVDYDRILKELTKAKEWMTIHWTALNSNAKKPNLREFCETNTLEYVRMINHTYALKKLENEDACQEALDAEIKAFTEKKAKKEAPPVPKAKKETKCLIKETAEMDCQTEDTLSDQSGISHEDYLKVANLDYERRVTLTDKYKKLVANHNKLLFLLKAQEGWADMTKDFDQEQKELLKRVIALIPSPKKPREDVEAEVAEKAKEYDELLESRKPAEDEEV